MSFYKNIGNREILAYKVAEQIYKDYKNNLKEQCEGQSELFITITPKIWYHTSLTPTSKETLIGQFDKFLWVQLARENPMHKYHAEALQCGRSLKKYMILVIKKNLLELGYLNLSTYHSKYPMERVTTYKL